MVELTVSWEEGLETAHERKKAKYAGLVMGYREEGCTKLPGRYPKRQRRQAKHWMLLLNTHYCEQVNHKVT